MKKTFLVILGLGVLASLFAHSGRTYNTPKCQDNFF